MSEEEKSPVPPAPPLPPSPPPLPLPPKRSADKERQNVEESETEEIADLDFEFSEAQTPPPAPPPPPPPLPVSIPLSPTAENTAAPSAPKIYKTELFLSPKTPPPQPKATVGENSPEQEPTSSTSPKGKTIRRNSPQRHIHSKVKFFEAEIAKEQEGARRNRRQSADLMKWNNKGTERTWGRSSHGKYYVGKSCGAINCPGNQCSGGRCGDERGGQSPASTSSTSENEPRSASSPVIKKSPVKMETVDEPITVAAINSQALILSKELGKVYEIQDAASYQRELSNAGSQLVVVQFYTVTNCRPCEAMQPIFLSLADAYRDVKFLQVDVEIVEVESILDELDVGHIPSFFFLRDAVQVAKVEGETEKAELEKIIRQYK